MRRSLFGAAALLAVACGGLLYDQGNGFPCDFNAAEDVRDKACAPTEVCSVLNRCERFVYEGPQFEGVPQQPDFDAGRKVHPLVLDSPVTLVTASAKERDEMLVVMRLDGGETRSVIAKLGTLNSVRESSLDGKGARQAAMVNANFGAVLFPDGGAKFLDGGTVPTGNRARALRVGIDVMGLLRERALKGSAISLDTNGNGAFYDLPPLPDGGQDFVLDLRWVPPSRKGVNPDGRAIVLTPEGFALAELDGGFMPLTAENAASYAIPFDEPRPAQLGVRHDQTGALWAFFRPKRTPEGLQGFPSVLSSWFLKRANEKPVSMERAWNDCSPCPNGRMFAIAPNLDGLANVEVLCGTSSTSPMTLVRVVGALSADPDDPCVTQPVTPGFDLSRRTIVENQPVVLDEANGGGVLVGGQQGQVWLGPSFSLALPLFLERVPLAIGTFNALGDVLPLIVTDRYLAAPLPAPGLPNGFKAVDFRKASDFVLDSDTGVRALVGGIGGWGVLSTGDLARVTVRPQPTDGGASGSFFALTYGPRLVTARGEAAREPFFGEAVTLPDGDIVSVVLTADDSVYLAPSPVESSAPNAQPALFPQLTPEPGSPIRSFALERTRLGTDGVNRVRGYAVTSRNLFTVSLSGAPARWSATPLLLGGGEPLEVWMDNPRGGLARVGYRDGNVFSLPGGFQLVRPTPGEEPRQVMDYENLGGWPVAYATSGLWVGHYDLIDGKLDNKLADGRPGKPMQWRRVTMRDGSTPWMDGKTARPARLHVLAGPPSRMSPYQQLFRLFIYLDDAVYEVGTMLRTNNSAPPN